MTRRPLILDRTPARELLVARIDEACGRLADLGYTPKAVYLTAADAKACGLGKLHGARDPGDPPRCRGLPIYGVKGAGGNKVYAKGGPSTSFKGIVL